MLTGLTDILTREGRPRFAYNVSSVEGLRAIVGWGESHQVPMILQCSERYLVDLGEAYFQTVVVPRLAASGTAFALHLDHATSLKAVVRGLRAGFSSVMFDGSALPLEANIEASRAALDLCREAGIPSFEAEIGHVGGAEDGDDDETQYFTRVEEAVRFAQAVPADLLAVSIGNAHGRYRHPPKIRWDLLQALHHALPMPLVLHGGTGISEDDLRRATTLGIRKINIGTELKTAWMDGLTAAIEDGEREPDRIRERAERSIASAIDRLERILVHG